mmetsp:Transcript_2468/g.4523  ORF Transcript_2468/g.4523 Transcript_2468/m.4523 type:complete len:235 (+) Transcript_2468:156-860(+)
MSGGFLANCPSAFKLASSRPLRSSSMSGCRTKARSSNRSKAKIKSLCFSDSTVRRSATASHLDALCTASCSLCDVLFSCCVRCSSAACTAANLSAMCLERFFARPASKSPGGGVEGVALPPMLRGDKVEPEADITSRGAVNTDLAGLVVAPLPSASLGACGSVAPAISASFCCNIVRTREGTPSTSGSLAGSGGRFSGDVCSDTLQLPMEGGAAAAAATASGDRADERGIGESI